MRSPVLLITRSTTPQDRRLTVTKSIPRPALALRIVAILLAVLLIMPSANGAVNAGSSPLLAQTEASADAVDLYDAVLPELREEVRAATAEWVDRYEITARMSANRGSVSGVASVTFVNRTPRPLDEVYFRLYPNAAHFGDDGLTLGEVRVQGRRIGRSEHELSDSRSLLRVPLTTLVRPGQSVDVEIHFETAAWEMIDDDLFWTTPAGGAEMWFLNAWYPVVAAYDNEQGWRREPLTFRDPIHSYETALYDVTITVPRDFHLVATGSAVGTTPREGFVDHRFVTGPVRDFTFVAARGLNSVSRNVQGTTISSYAPPDALEAAELALHVAAGALAAYSDQFGRYPFKQLSIIQSDWVPYGGLAVSGIIFVDGLVLTSHLDHAFDPIVGLRTEEEARNYYELLVAHEVGHQWWGMSVESDYSAHTFLVEGLTQYLAVAYVEWTHGEQAAYRMLILDVARPYLETLRSTGDRVADRSVGDAPDHLSDPGIIYGKAALGFLAIRVEIGDEAFFGALHQYATDNAFGITTPADLRAAFEVASGQDLGYLWQTWFEEAGMTLEDVQALLGAMAATAALPVEEKQGWERPRG